MPTTINIDTNSYLYKSSQLTENDLRYKQYFEGIQKIYQFNIDKKFDIYIADNSDFFDKETELKEYISKTSIVIIKNIPNNYGCKNKGSGLIENWIHNKDVLSGYDWIIHFEPRQLLISNQFIDSFLENPRNLFTMGTDMRQYNTGLFCIKCKVLLDFINEYTPEKLVNNNLNIEAAIYNFIINNNIDYKTIDKMNLIWFPTNHSPINM
jgi:mannose-1-phosphate guanylyltransferase